MPLQDLSIRGKVTAVAMAVSVTALLLSSTGFLVYDLTRYRSELRQDLQTQAAIIGANSTAALAFGDRAAAAETLSALRAKEGITAAALYQSDGRIFAVFLPGRSSARDLPVRPTPGSLAGARDRFEVLHEITMNGDRLGTLYLRSDLRHWYGRLGRYASLVTLLMLGAAGIALVLSSRLQAVISGPILSLRDSMGLVSASQDYAVRVRKTSNDELGALFDGFNAMLGEIQRRDAAVVAANDELSRMNDTLEQRVAERSAAAEQRARELAQSEETQRRQKRTLHSILHSIGDGVIVADEHGIVSLSNPAAEQILRVPLTSTSAHDWAANLGFCLADMATPVEAGDLPLSRAIRGESVNGADFYLPNAEAGEGRWLSISARPVRDEDGLTHSGVAVVRDITEQKRTERDLLAAKDAAERANRAKSAFLANMSHELRTPLNAIIGYSEMLQEDAIDGGHAEYVPDLQKVHTAGKHLLTLINDVLDLSKIEAGKMHMTVEQFDVASLVDDLVTTITPLVKKEGNALDVSVSAGTGLMTADLTKVRQILFNLLSNACKFTSEGRITLSASRARDDAGTESIVFRVQDSGIGIAPADVGKLFQDFTQADPSTTRKYGGTGLGLAISRRFCQMLGGTIAVESALGEGSTFIVRLPARAVVHDGPAPRLVAPGTAVAVPAPSGGPKKVLIVDDDAATRQLIAEYLRKQGFAPIHASGGLEALAAARRERPAAITLDVLMPGMDGWAVLNALKAEPGLADIPVVMVSFLDDQRMGYALGAAEYLTKPINADQLAAVLKRFTADPATASVLIVEDDAPTRELLRRRVEELGCSVREAENGRVGLERLREEAPGIILLDLMMPEVDGFQFVEAMREDEAWRRIPVAIITAKDLSHDERQRLNGQVVSVLHKNGTNCDTLLPDIVNLMRTMTGPEPPVRSSPAP